MRPSSLWLLLAAALWGLAAAPKPLADPAAEYAARATKLGDKNPKGWLKLADFCEENLLWDRRGEALRKSVQLEPENAEAHLRLDEARAGKDWLPVEEAEAREVEEAQTKGLTYYGSKWIPAKEADRLREADRKTEGWKLQVRVDTPHLRVFSTQTLDFTRRLAGLLENELATYQRFYGKVWKLAPNPAPFKVHCFADRDGFLTAYTAQGGGAVPEDASGIYLGKRKILFVGVCAGGESPDKILGTAVHEMLHALDDLLAGCAQGSPLWMAEGRADHFAYGILGRQVLPGYLKVPKDSARLTSEEMILAVGAGDVLSLDAAGFRKGRIREHYAFSCAWVHFLFHGEGGKHAAGFRNYLAGCPAESSKADFERAVGRLSDLQPAFEAYVREQYLPAAKALREQAP